MSEYLNGIDVAKMLNCSVNTTIKLKRRLGLTKGKRFHVDDMPEVRKLYAEWLKEQPVRRKGKGVDHTDHFNEAMVILKKNGYIEADHLLDIFNVSLMANINSFFESMGEPLYKGRMKLLRIDPKTQKKRRVDITIYKLFNVLKEKYREENRACGNGKLPKNGAIVTNQRSTIR